MMLSSVRSSESIEPEGPGRVRHGAIGDDCGVNGDIGDEFRRAEAPHSITGVLLLYVELGIIAA